MTHFHSAHCLAQHTKRTSLTQRLGACDVASSIKTSTPTYLDRIRCTQCPNGPHQNITFEYVLPHSPALRVNGTHTCTGNTYEIAREDTFLYRVCLLDLETKTSTVTHGTSSGATGGGAAISGQTIGCPAVSTM